MTSIFKILKSIQSPKRQLVTTSRLVRTVIWHTIAQWAHDAVSPRRSEPTTQWASSTLRLAIWSHWQEPDYFVYLCSSSCRIFYTCTKSKLPGQAIIGNGYYFLSVVFVTCSIFVDPFLLIIIKALFLVTSLFWIIDTLALQWCCSWTTCSQEVLITFIAYVGVLVRVSQQ